MVVKFEGSINGNDVIFEKKEGGLWETTVPSNLKGMYTVALTATDEAGNSSFITGKLYVVDAERLCVHLILDEYYAEIIKDEYDVKVVQDEYMYEIIPEEFKISLVQDEYIAEVVHPVCNKKEGTRLEC